MSYLMSPILNKLGFHTVLEMYSYFYYHLMQNLEDLFATR